MYHPEGAPGDSRYIVARGKAYLLGAGEGKAVATPYGEDIVAEAAPLHGTPRNATISVVTPSLFYKPCRRDFKQLSADALVLVSLLFAVDE